MSDNVLTILGIQDREDAITNLLAYCFNSSGEFRVALLRSICGQETTPTERWTAYTRLSLAGAGVPDLVLHGGDGPSGRLIVIENKLKADEGEDQTARYCSPEAIAALSRRFDVKRPPTFVFLTLFPDQRPNAGPPWVTTTYRQLLDVFEANSLPSDSIGSKLLSDWRDLMADFYDSAVVTDEDIFLEKLRGDRGLEGNYLYFISFMQDLNLANRLTLEDWFRSSQTGRRYYGAVISKADWHPEEMKPDLDGRWHLDAVRHFNIHVEPQFNVLTGVLNLYIHYEINPYRPDRWVTANVDFDERRAYGERRQRFIGAFANRVPLDVVIAGGCNQIGKATCDFVGSTTEAVRHTLERLIETISLRIDESLQQLAGQP
jgi:hypothetical protein